jgi:phycoerythrobilin:ferredoxin oxidoreductase
MQIIRNNSQDPISISNWRWSYFLDETIKAFSNFQTRPYPIYIDFLFRESFFGSSSNPKKVILQTWGLKMEKIRQARCACLQAGEITSVMNLVISPLNNYDLPFFWSRFCYTSKWTSYCIRSSTSFKR